MMASGADGSDVWADWIDRFSGMVPRSRGRRGSAAAPGLRFAFYGRISTVEYQDPASSSRWQYDSAIDPGHSRGRDLVVFVVRFG
jgi:site-specific DNA recombinase